MVRLKWIDQSLRSMWIRGALAGGEVVAGEVEVLPLDGLPVVPDGLAVEAPELVAGDLHGHVRLWISVLCVPSVWIIQMRSTFCHGPSWQYISSVGSVGEKSRWLTQSVRVQQRVKLPGLQVDRVQRERDARGQPLLHHLRPCSAAARCGPSLCRAG